MFLVKSGKKNFFYLTVYKTSLKENVEFINDFNFFRLPKMYINSAWPMTLLVRRNHRRRFELEDKSKVVASDWGTVFISPWQELK